MPHVKRVEDSVVPKFVVLEINREAMYTLAIWCSTTLTGHTLTFPLQAYGEDIGCLAEIKIPNENDAMLFSMRWC